MQIEVDPPDYSLGPTEDQRKTPEGEGERIISQPENPWRRFLPSIIIIIGLFVIITASGLVYYFNSSSKQPESENGINLTVTPELSLAPSTSPSPSVTANPWLKPTPTSKPTVNTTTYQPTPSPGSTSIPTPSPTPRVSNPPIVNISYPSEMQSVEFTDPGQQFCVVDIPAGGDTSGVQRRHNINDGGWSSYADIFVLCFDPREGLNRLQLQYRNKYGDESTTYTRQFNFHLATPTPTQASLPQGCTPVTFSESKTGGTTTVTVTGAWWLSVKANPQWSSANFDESQKIIYLYFTVPSGTVYIYRASYDGAPLCQTYQFGSM